MNVGTLWGLKRVSDTLELVVSCLVVAGNQIQVFCKSRKCSEPRSHLSRSCFSVFRGVRHLNFGVAFEPHHHHCELYLPRLYWGDTILWKLFLHQKTKTLPNLMATFTISLEVILDLAWHRAVHSPCLFLMPLGCIYLFWVSHVFLQALTQNMTCVCMSVVVVICHVIRNVRSHLTQQISPQMSEGTYTYIRAYVHTCLLAWQQCACNAACYLNQLGHLESITSLLKLY